MATDNGATAPTGLSEAGDLMSGFLSDDLLVNDTEGGADVAAQLTQDEEAPPPAEKPKAEAPKAPEQSDETSTEDDTADGDGDGSKEETDEQEAEQDEEQDEDEGAQPDTFTVKVDGKEVQVSRDEVVAGYQRQADYSRKTQALADDRRAFDAIRAEHTKEVEAVSQERGQYKVLLNQLQAALDQLAPKEPDWQELFARDKNEYLIARDNWRAIQEQREAVKAEADRVSAVERENEQKALHQRISHGQAKLLEWEPKWKDLATRHKDWGDVMEYAKTKLGYTEQEIAASNDHRALFAIYKAMRLDAIEAEAKNVQQKAVKKGQKVLKAGGSTTTPASQKQRSEKAAMKRLVKNGGRTEDAAGIMEGFLDL
jgi:hypothetical protein